MPKFLLILSLGVWLAGCTNFRAYYNTFFLAEKAFQVAEDNRLKTKVDKVTPTTKRLYEEAITKASRVLAFYPKSKYVDDALLIIGKSYYYQEEYPKAEKKFQEIVAGFPQSKLVLEANFFLGLTYSKLDRLSDAAQVWQIILQNPKQKKFQKEALYSQAQLRFQQKDYDEAILLYRNFLIKYKKDSKAALAQRQIAETFWEKREYENAWKAYTEIKNYTQDKELIYQAEFKAGQTAYQLNKITEGMAIFKRLAENSGYYSHLREIKLQLALGLLESGQVEEAVKLNQEVITDHPKTAYSAQAYYQLGILQQDKKGDLKTAKEMFDKSKDEAPTSEYAKKALEKSADITKLEEYRKVLSEGETEKSVETQFLLGEFYLTHLNQPDSALAAYKNIVVNNPTSEYAPKALLAVAYICGSILGDSSGCRQACEELIKNYPFTDYAMEAYQVLQREPPLTDSLTATFLFQQAEEQFFTQQNPDSALRLYQKILDFYPNSIYLPKAMLGKAHILEHHHQLESDSNWIDSTVFLAYSSILEQFPDSEAARVAQLKLGLKERPKPKPEQSKPAPPDTLARVETTAAAEGDTTDTLILGLPRAPEPLSKGIFVYPPEFIPDQISGFVYLKIEIDYFTGEVKKIEIMKGVGNQEIERRVLEAMRVAKFDTQRLNPSYFEGVYGYRFKIRPPLSQNQ